MCEISVSVDVADDVVEDPLLPPEVDVEPELIKSAVNIYEAESFRCSKIFSVKPASNAAVFTLSESLPPVKPPRR